MTKQDVLRHIFTRKSAPAPWRQARDCVNLIALIDAFSMLLEEGGGCLPQGGHIHKPL